MYEVHMVTGGVSCSVSSFIKTIKINNHINETENPITGNL